MREQWVPEYRATRDRLVHISEIRTRECPVSFITAETKQILSQILNARTAYKATGASLFGPDLSAWPVWAVEASHVIEAEYVAVENAIAEAMLKRSEE